MIQTEAWQQTFLGSAFGPLQNSAGLNGNTRRVRKLFLDKLTYAAGGEPLDFQNSCLSCITDACQLLGRDPNGCDIVPAGVQAKVVWDATGCAKLQLWINGAEAPAGWTGAAGSYIWISFVGAS
jgi:hypothetical protein